jgi:hypothetical protein
MAEQFGIPIESVSDLNAFSKNIDADRCSVFFDTDRCSVLSLTDRCS